MGKIGRNEPCPCGSGIKYKRCCLKQAKVQPAVSSMGQLKISLMTEIERIQNGAKRHEETLHELGVFILWSNAAGAAWLLEITESDAVKLAENGEPLPVPIDENPETIEINWSHSFAIRDRNFYLTSHQDNSESCLNDAPTKRINAAIRRIRKRFSEEQLRQVHLDIPQEVQGGES